MRNGFVVCGFVAAVAISGSALAEDWDHDANIEAAVGGLVATWRQDGLAGMEKLVAACYGAIDGAGASDEQLRKLESCASMDFAAYVLDRGKVGAEGRVATAYFAAERIMGRMGRLSVFVTAPGVENQVLRAWSRAAIDALERAGL